MIKKRDLLHTRKKKKSRDPCPICEEDLYYNSKYSKRVGLFDTKSMRHEIIGWACPHCKSEFDIHDNIVYIYGQDFTQGTS